MSAVTAVFVHGSDDGITIPPTLFALIQLFTLLGCAGKVFRIGTVRYNWPMSAHASQAFNIAHRTDSEDLPCADFRGHVISQ